jgi:hypothetical protein
MCDRQAARAVFGASVVSDKDKQRDRCPPPLRRSTSASMCASLANALVSGVRCVTYHRCTAAAPSLYHNTSFPREVRRCTTAPVKNSSSLVTGNV